MSRNGFLHSKLTISQSRFFSNTSEKYFIQRTNHCWESLYLGAHEFFFFCLYPPTFFFFFFRNQTFKNVIKAQSVALTFTFWRGSLTLSAPPFALVRHIPATGLKRGRADDAGQGKRGSLLFFFMSTLQYLRLSSTPAAKPSSSAKPFSAINLY